MTARHRPTLFLLLIVIGGCDLLDSPSSMEHPGDVQITYVAAGGIGGGLLNKISITSGGLVTDSLKTPLLHLQLRPEEYDELLALFSGFFAFDERYEDNVCADDITFSVQYRKGELEKTVSAAGCTLFDNGAKLKKLKRIVEALGLLAQRVYKEKAPWLGLEADFTIERDTYDVGETITFNYRILNPTDDVRTLYFLHDARLNFRVYRQGFPGFSYLHVQRPERTDLTSLEFAPGEEKTLYLEWNQRDQLGNLTSLEPGRYRFVLSLLDTGHLRSDSVSTVDIVDPAVRLAGYVDGQGEDSSELDYTFRLHIRNWTTSPVVLDFPYRERIYVELYDLDRPEPGPLLFEGPEHPTEEPSTLVLQPGETHLLEFTVPKGQLNLNHSWYLARVKLMTSNVEFSRESQLRISKPR